MPENPVVYEAIVQPPVHVYEVFEREVEIEDPTDIHKITIKQAPPVVVAAPPPSKPYDWTWVILLAILLLILLCIFCFLCCCGIPSVLKGPLLKAK